MVRIGFVSASSQSATEPSARSKQARQRGAGSRSRKPDSYAQTSRRQSYGCSGSATAGQRGWPSGSWWTSFKTAAWRPARTSQTPAVAAGTPRPSGSASTGPYSGPKTAPSSSGGNDGSSLVDELHQAAKVVRMRVRQYAVAQVEDVARAASGAAKDVLRGRLHALPWAEEDRRVEVALDAPVLADLRPAAVERDAPVEADHVAARVAHRSQQVRGARAEVDRGRAHRAQDPGRPRRDEL